MRTTGLLALLAASIGSACSEGHTRMEVDAGRMDAGRGDDGGGGIDVGLPDAMCGYCPPECTLTPRGPTVCPTCECPPPACADDSDCAVAFDHGVCCPSCTSAYLRTNVAGSACLVRFGDPPPPISCAPDGCPPKPCPDVDCALAARAVCAAGACEPRSDCPAGTVLQFGECWPACETDADCELAIDVSACCPGCQQAYPRALVGERECIAGMAERPGPECAAPACPDIPCPPVSCVAGRAVCLADGACGFAAD